MSWIVLVNPRAGKRPVDADRLAAILASKDVPAETRVVDSAADMRAAVAEVATSGRDLVVAGGDGTVSMAVDVLVGGRFDRMPRLGVLPTGTGCDLMRTFGFAGLSLEGAIERLHGDATYHIDVGRLSGAWGDRCFVNVAQTGVGAAAAETAPRISRSLGSVRYPMAFAARLPRFPAGRVRIGGSRTMEGPALGVIIANGQFFAGGWNIAPKALLVDGAFDVQVIDARKVEAPVLVPKLMAGTHLGLPNIWRRSMSHITVEVDQDWPVEADGDFLGRAPFEASVVPGAIELKV
jgi:diacylglycerol kinase (ATP)